MIEVLSVVHEALADEFNLPHEQVAATCALLEEGCPVSFIARYRKDQTGNLSEEDVAKIAVAFQKSRQLADRKLSFSKTIDAQGKLTVDLEKQIRETKSAGPLEDLYLPYRSKRGSLAQTARDKGLEPLANAILTAADESQELTALAATYVDASKGVADAEEALKGAAEIIAEKFAETFELRGAVRDVVQRTGKLVVKKAQDEPVVNAEETKNEPAEPVAETPEPAAEEKPVEETTAEEKSAENAEAAKVETAKVEAAPEVAEPAKKADKKKPTKEKRQERRDRQFADLVDTTVPLRNCPAYRLLEINRGEIFKVLNVELDVDVNSLKETARKLLVGESRPYAAFLNDCVDDGLVRLALPSLMFEARREASERAEEQAANVCARSLRNLLLQKPLTGRRILAVEPSLKKGCKLVALDESGAVLGQDLVVVQGSAERRAAATAKIIETIDKYNVSVVAIGSGVGSREAEILVSEVIEKNYADKDVAYLIVNDVGAGAYATSQAAKDDLPNFDQAVRSAASLGRRVQDPLNELVKIDPEKLCFGLYQHDVRPRALKDALTNVVSSCVDKVGVDLNAASPAMLRYVAGLNPLIAKRVCERRAEIGAFQTREQLKEVPGFTDLAFERCAAFVKVVGGSNPLDATWIHPESYELATKILEKLGLTADDLRDASKRDEIAAKVAEADASALAEEFSAGAYTVADILEQFVNPGADARDAFAGPIFKKGTLKLEDIKPGMELVGSVSSVVTFGVFVDVGLLEHGLIHISHLGRSYVNDPSQVLFVGDVVKVRVLDVDVARRRFSLIPVSSGQGRERRREGRRRSRPENAEGEQKREQKHERRPRRDEESGGERRERPRRDGKSRDNREDRAPRSISVGPKEKVVVPLSDEMKSGKEPLRSFSDLAQLFGRLQANDDEKKEKK
ncbi:MAG: helix-hairpin-helix domain-containing protein [Thermoguttaceae bacterium]|nr:helix-hairpin-helix domain-containing protein [Thermoguttaceae bacterium]